MLLSRSRVLRRILPSLLVASVLATGLSVSVGTKPVSAACYWSSYKTDTRTQTRLVSVTITSSVKFRTGYTCNGNVNELHVYSLAVTIKLNGDPADWWGYTRYLRSIRIEDGYDGVVVNYVNTRSCAAANCTMSYSATPNKYYYASGLKYTDSRLWIYCEDCSYTSLGGWFYGHWFVQGTSNVDYCAC